MGNNAVCGTQRHVHPRTASKGEIQVNIKPVVLWKFLVLSAVAVLSISVVPSFAQASQAYVVNNPQGAGSYNVNYTITGATIEDMRVDSADTSLVLLINSTGDGNLVVDLPRSLIDAKAGSGDDQFIVLVDDTYSSFHEDKSGTDRTLTIPFAVGSQRIEVIGTQVVPEFGPAAAAVLAVSVLAIVAVSNKARLGFRQ